MKQRYFIELSYRGTHFHGWQIQPNANSVQETLEKGLSIICRETITVTGSGRTDTGVHAAYYVAHFDSTHDDLDKPDFTHKLNSFFSSEIAVFAVIKVAFETHARFDAVSRTYHYYIHQQKDPFLQDTSWFFPKRLNVENMNNAARLLTGQHDFTSFSKLHTDVKTNICIVHEAFFTQNDHQLIFKIAANRFLRNMVRSIVGTLVDIGLGKLSPEDVGLIMESLDRSKAGVSVPAHGLFLTDVSYPNIQKHGVIPSQS